MNEAREVIARLFPANKVWSIRPFVAADMVLDALHNAGLEVRRRPKPLGVTVNIFPRRHCPSCGADL